jgi:hypothetical protein
LHGINSDNFHQVLALFESYGSRLFHAKVTILKKFSKLTIQIALFVSEVLQSAKAKPILEKYTSENDLKNLSLIAYSMTFSSEIPLDIFPFDQATHLSLLRVFPTVSFSLTFSSLEVNLILPLKLFLATIM